MKRLLLFLAIITSIISTNLALTDNSTTIFSCAAAAPNDGTFTRTSSSVSVYTENGHRKGAFTVYLHKGLKYIDFQNSWICIQGKSRFSHNGNWYVIK